MKTAAVICELNPPHSGHAYLFRRIREQIGFDTAIIAIMGGSYMQRGDVAVCDAYARARMALSIGANLVLELPFPYSMCTAQRYADAGVAIANALGCVDYLCFGSESGDIEQLTRISLACSGEAVSRRIEEMRSINRYRSFSFAELRTMALAQELNPIDAEAAKRPNNILAIEYLNALRTQSSTITPFTVTRRGAYHADTFTADGFPSASAIRKLISEQKFNEISKHLTKEATALLAKEVETGHCPADLNRLSAAVITKLSATSQDAPLTAEIDASLARRLRAALKEAATLQELITLTKAKHYTDAHIRRALLFAYFGVTSSDIREVPAFTRLLAADSIGCERLKIIKKTAWIPILTKTADFRTLPTEAARRQAEFAAFAESVYYQTLPKPQSAADVFRKTPFVRK